MTRFLNRADAGRRLASHLTHLVRDHPLVLAVPRGGVPVAAEVAAELGLPLDVLVVRKLGVPSNPELAMGAVGEEGVRVLDDAVLRVRAGRTHMSWPRWSVGSAPRSRPGHDASGGPVRRRRCAAGWWWSSTTASPPARRCGPPAPWPARGAPAGWSSRCPVAAVGALAQVGEEADDMVCLASPEPFVSVSRWYAAFDQVADEDVLLMLAADRVRPRPGVPGP